MSEILQKFVDTLPEDIQKQVCGKKNKKTLAILREQGISVPQHILDAMETKTSEIEQHDNIMDSMRCFMGQTPANIPCKIIR